MSYKHFDIHASIVFRLGDELISDEIQALVELVKNAYDADATIVKIEVNTKDLPPPNSHFSTARGYIIIEDDGTGMTERTIEDGWLFLSNSAKREFKKLNKTTRLGRTPLGDKGLGRLGVQRLGWKIEIITRPSNQIADHNDTAKEYQVAIDWQEYLGPTKLTSIDVFFNSRSTNMKSGTSLIISDLRNVDVWKGSTAIGRLQMELSRMISPFKRIRDFMVSVVVDGIPLELAKIAEDIRDTSPLRYFIEFKGEQFRAIGKAKLAYLNPSKNDLALYEQYVANDNGAELLEFLQKDKRANQFNLKRATEENWFVEFTFTRNLIDFSGLALDENLSIANPGTFDGEIDFFYLNQLGSNQEIFDKTSEYKQYVKDLSGITIYRDGFGIRTGADWLGLRSSQTSGRSVFVLRPDNTIGYIAITSLNNSKLTETTNREGFVVNAYSDNFFEMLKQFIEFTEKAQEFIRRGFVDFRKSKASQSAQNIIGGESTPEAILENVKTTFQESIPHRDALRNFVQAVKQMVTSPDNPITDINSENIALNTVEIKELEILINNAERSLQYFSIVEQRVELLNIITDQLEVMREQLSLSYETMGLGLTAEALSHEINNIITQLLYRTDAIVKYINKNKFSDRTIHGYIDYVSASTNGLRKQLSHFAPSLRYVREKRENIDLIDFFNEIKEFYENRYKTKFISIDFKHLADEYFVVYMNKGKLTQVVDNIILNSEYWLEEALRLNKLNKGIVTIELKKPYIYISDNGRGIEPSVELSLFEPFITTKRTGAGRGLGLFIVNQLLDSDGCSIRLLNKRNSTNRLYIFEINLLARIIK